MSKPLTDQELHNLAMNFVGRELEFDGFEFMAVNSNLGRQPQFVCLKDCQLYFIMVKFVPFPKDPNFYDNSIMHKMATHALKSEAKLFYAGVGVSNAEDRNLPIYLDQPYILDYHGLVEI
jgi:hypothetical protein